MRVTLWIATLSTALGVLPAQGQDSVIKFNEARNDSLTTKDPLTARTGMPAKTYVYQHDDADPDTILILARSGDFDTYLVVTAENGDIWENDDSGFGLDASVIVAVRKGRYAIQVSSVDTVGRFQLLIRRPSPTDLQYAEATTPALGPPTSLEVDCVSRSRAPTSGGRDTLLSFNRDRLHPKDFTWVFERPRRRYSGESEKAVTVYRSPVSGSAAIAMSPETEIDRFSHITIEWDRDMLWQIASRDNLSITVRARVESPSGARNAEVWSYSTIGQQRRTVGTAIRNVINLRTSITGLIATMCRHVPEIQAAVNGHRNARAAELLTNTLPAFGTYLDFLAKPDNGLGFDIVAKGVDMDPNVVVRYAEQLLRLLKPVRDDPKGTPADSTLVEQFLLQSELLRRQLVTLSQALERPNAQEMIAKTQLISQLKDGDIFVPETGARPGDRIIIEVENDAIFDSVPRILKIPMRVVDFGLNQTTRDAFYFVSRLNAPKKSSADIIDTLEKTTTTPGATATKTVPLGSDFIPTPGVTYGWGWYPRNVLGSTGITGIIRWLHPGFGISVIFPRFGNRVVSFTAADTSGPATASVEESSATINVGAGLMGSLFNGAVQVTYGWNLTTDRKRKYWGLGFSFVRLVGVVAGQNGD